jgi:hypothetical protein
MTGPSKTIFLLLVLWMHAQELRAQEVFLKHFSVDDGLPSNETYQVLQDVAGNLLVATDRGAVSFDGYSFENIRMEKEQASTPTYYMYRSPKGRIYFSGLKGHLYEYDKKQLRNYPLNHQLASLFRHPGLLIANSVCARGDSLLISYNNDYNYNFKIGSCVVTPSGEVRKIEKPDGIYFDLSRNFFFRQLSDTDFLHKQQPVYITWPDGAQTRDVADLSWRSGYIRRLYHERLGDYDLFCLGRLIIVYKDRKRVSAREFSHNILSLTIMNGQQFCVGLENGGAQVYEVRRGKVEGPVQSFLGNLTVTCVYRDTQGGTWFATQEDGLFYSYPSQVSYWESDSKIVGIAHRKGRVFVGYRDGRIGIFEKGRKTHQFQLPPQTDHALLRMSFDYHDSVLVLTESGNYLRQGKGWKFYAGADVFLLPIHEKLSYGAASAFSELHTYLGLGGKLAQKTSLSKRIISMYYDSSRQLWIGTLEGLLKYADHTLSDLTKDNPVFQDRIVSISELPGKKLAVASLGSGLAVCTNGNVYTLTVANGLITPVINSMAIDGNVIWLGTNKGLTRVRFENGAFRVRHFGIESGLPTIDVHQFTVAGGWLYLKWINRLVTIPIDSLVKPDHSTTHLTSVVVNGETTEVVEGARFSYGQNSLRFHFNSINLSKATQQEFYYLLDGFDREWKHTRERYVDYTNLPPGRYQFRVKALDKQGNIRAEQAVYSFSIRAAFWHKWWFPALLVVPVLLLSYLAFRLRLNSIRKKNQLLLDLADSQQKALSQLINPHFIFNLLNTVQASVLKQEKLAAASVISRFAKLMRLSMELRKQKYVSVAKEMEMLQQYFELEALRIPDKFSYDIHVDELVNPHHTWIPSMLIQPFVENALHHGLMHLSQRKGYVSISLHLRSKSLVCVVDDNGIGRREAAIVNEGRGPDHQSTGMDVTIHRLRLLHKERGTDYVYEVTDKTGGDGQPQGTTITFSIPFKTTA